MPFFGKIGHEPRQISLVDPAFQYINEMRWMRIDGCMPFKEDQSENERKGQCQNSNSVFDSIFRTINLTHSNIVIIVLSVLYTEIYGRVLRSSQMIRPLVRMCGRVIVIVIYINKNGFPGRSPLPSSVRLRSQEFVSSGHETSTMIPANKIPLKPSHMSG